LVAATAMDKGLVVVTDNEKHFRRIKGLEVENWLK
jgi:predicted nucleic acid-binding protein